MGVIFNGASRVMQLSPGTTEVDVKRDIYTAWKTWVLEDNNAGFQPAISAIGGDPISDVISLGTTFFLENGWKVRPYEGNHFLTVSGNLFTRDGTSPFIPTLGAYNVSISLNRSNLIDTVATGGSSGGSNDTAALNQIKASIAVIDEKVDDMTALALARV